MSNKLKTGLLLGVVLFLLITTLYVSYILKNESESAPTTITKTQAVPKTYGKTIALNPTTEVPTPTPTVASFAAVQNPSVTPTSSPFAVGARASDVSPTPTPFLLAAAVTTVPSPTATVAPSPTETLLAAISATATPVASVSATSTVEPTVVATSSLPEAGWIKASHLLFMFAFSLIFFSLLY